MGSQAADDSSSYPAEVVAKAFVEKYYMILHSSPEYAHHFYQDSSVLGRPGPDGTMTSVTTMQGISDKIMSLDYKDSLATIVTVCAQGSIMGSVIVGVTGYLTGHDNVKRNFSQTFFLAQQEKGFYVLNDFLHFTDPHNSLAPLPVDNVDENTSAAPLTQEKEPALVCNLPDESQTSTPTEATVNISDESDIKNSSVEEMAAFEPSPIKSQNDSVPTTTDLASNAKDVRRTSYASIVAKESTATSPDNVPVSTIVRVAANADQQPCAAAAPNPSQQPRAAAAPNSSQQPRVSAARNPSQQQPRASGAPNANQQQPRASVAPNTNQQPSTAPNANQQPRMSGATGPSQQPSASEALSGNQQANASVAPRESAPPSDGVPQNSNAHIEAKGIYIGGLPMDITYPRLEVVVKKFGPIKEDGIQIRRYEDGFTFGFVEFESSKSAHNAVEAHTITFGEKEAYIDFKRSNMQGGNNRGRFPSGGGGYRSGNFRSRESYGEGRPNGNGRNNYVNRYVSGQAHPPPRGSFGGRNGEANGRVYQNGGGRTSRG